MIGKFAKKAKTRRTSTLALVALSGFVFGGATLSAMAQEITSENPIQVTAEEKAEYRRDEGEVIYNGNVRVVQGDTEITSDTLTVVCVRSATRRTNSAQDCNEIEHILADGNVYFSTPDEKIHASRGEYDLRQDTITFTGDVILSRGEEGVVKGAKVVYEIDKGRATITSEGGAAVLGIFNGAPSEADSGLN